MDFFQQWDAPIFSRTLACLPQKESLALVCLQAQWRHVVGGAFRMLLINRETPLACVALIARAGGFTRLRELCFHCVFDCSLCETITKSVVILRSADMRLERLVLRDISFGGDEGQCLATGVAQLKLLEEVLLLAKESTSLRKLELNRVAVTSHWAPTAALKALLGVLADDSHPPALEELEISDCPQVFRCVRDAVFGQLGARLRRLNLSGGGLQAGGAGTLALALPRMTRLEVLSLGGNGMGPPGAQSLGQGLVAIRDSLQELDLSENGLGHEGVRLLAEPLSQCYRLRVLRLRGGWTSSQGVDALLDLLRGSAPRLEQLDLSQNRLPGASVRAFLDNLPDFPELRWLNLSENSFATAEFAAGPGSPNMARLAEAAPQLHELHLSGIALGSDEFALRAIIPALPQTLGKLILSGSALRRIMKVMGEVFPPMPELRELTMVQAQLDDVALSELADWVTKGALLPRLRVLDIRGNVGVTVASVDQLRQRLMKCPAFRDLRSSKSPAQAKRTPLARAA